MSNKIAYKRLIKKYCEKNSISTKTTIYIIDDRIRTTTNISWILLKMKKNKKVRMDHLLTAVRYICEFEELNEFQTKVVIQAPEIFIERYCQ